ncbi:MAG: copper resistance protein NlpE N-terminal domain-containing protein [Chitinophagales bacterium]
MNRNYYFFIPVLFLIACTSKPKLPQELHLPAVYYGMIPCADCKEIDYELTLQENFIYEERRMYAGKSDSMYLEKGRWYIKNDSVIVIEQKMDESTQFLVDSNALIMLDKSGNRITGGTAEMYYLKLGSRKNLAQVKTDAEVDPYAAKRVAGIDFIATGNEPFWSLEINYESKMHFNVMDGSDIFLEIPPSIYEKNQIIYISEVEGKKFEAIVISETCTDNMSGEKKEFRVICNYDNTTYNGCGTYLNTKYALNGSWQLQMLLSNDLKIEPSKFPVIIFDVAQNKVMGNNGCNNYNGSVKITDTEIAIDKNLASTKMACEGTIENEYMQELSGGTFRYILNDNQLRLIAEDVVTMDFVRLSIQ